MKTSNLRRTRMKDWYEFYREICPVCHKRGGCMINGEGDTVACIRTESKIQFSKQFPSWIHYLKEKRKSPKNEDHQAYFQGNKKAEDSKLHDVYSSFLQNIELTKEHYDHLSSEKRGMTHNEILIRQYTTFPDKPWNTAKKMLRELTADRLVGIPGFFENDYGWSVSGSGGILIPYRNIKNQIVGFQTRADKVPNIVEIQPGSIDGLQARVLQQPDIVQILVDGEIIEEVRLEKGVAHFVNHESKHGFVTLKGGQRYYWLSSANKKNGTGSGNPLPIHVALPSSQLNRWESGTVHCSRSVWITEGALKADIAAEHIERVYDPEELVDVGSTVLGIPGVNTWRSVLPALKEMRVQHVNIAFDMDSMTNPYVAQYLKELAMELKNKGYTANIAIWNENDGNGIDDLLINRRFPQLKKLF